MTHLAFAVIYLYYLYGVFLLLQSDSSDFKRR